MPDPSQRRSYIVILGEGGMTTVPAKIKSSYRSHYEAVDGRVFFIKTSDLTSDVKEKIGIGEANEQDGAVFRLNGSYAGYFNMGLWDWLE